MLPMTPSELLLAGLLAAVLVLLVWLLVRSYTRERAVRDQLVDALADQMEQQLGAQHREILRDLHEGLARQTDRIGEHARADRDLLQRGLTAASVQLSRGMQALTQSVDGRLDTLSGQVNQRLDEGFRKTNETFASVMARLATIDEAQKKIDGLTTNVVSLQELLGDKRARGAFGEVQLEALVQNMLPPDAFAFQHVLPNGTRVDCLLTLPAPTGLVAVDAKFPLENYHRMFDAAAGELERRAAQQAFRADVRRHVDAIAGKYILPGTTSDGAVMFLPAEAVFAEVHAYHPEIVAYAQQKRVWIVSPTTLMAVLNTARAVLKDVETRKQVHVIQDALGKLAKDFQRFDERMAALARHIEQASRDVQDVQTSSRKISAHFHKIEAARFDELESDADEIPLPRT
ncbi:MAG: DNA recombination protein RmuC [Thauera propionica]|jgi:DNA recombination protein RmuC|uniref:DNA recombination protein RmuC n=1 Tax=Thauera propionica TaxID=2019431 RepID=A0A235EZK5_9RHOO|nr:MULTISPECIES: DNA recombination protein RmuC [Thauera]MDD3676330.1 DNA recombination protein RmuC [Thauera propionica]MDI3490113.1 recombination protein RmuC [Thauera sp.]MDY0048064.1 DNA recombination protein RmuC [Thauera propionica]OYD54203.1 DNA recombination protein RmuC [Thauera propionica]